MDFWFSREYVQSGGSYLSASECSNQIFVCHQATPKQFVWVFMINRFAFQVRGQLRAIAVVNIHPEPPRAARHRLSYVPHPENAEDFAANLPAQEHVGTQGPPSPCSNQLLGLVSTTRSAK